MNFDSRKNIGRNPNGPTTRLLSELLEKNPTCVSRRHVETLPLTDLETSVLLVPQGAKREFFEATQPK